MPALWDRRTLLQAAALAPALSLFAPTRLGAAPATGFTHSVASGDPSRDGVTLWTRFVTADGAEARLKVEVAEDEGFRRIAARGTATASPINDHCAHARPSGLRPGRWYHYRFIAPDGSISPIGRTRTLPAGSIDAFRIGVFSCANATSGWFNAYAHAAARDDLDLIVHLGDYIYESPTDRSDAIAELATSRAIMPTGEAISLADYRLRYASYRADPALQELHRRFPMIVMWDDHETANNSWTEGAKNHGPEDGNWDVRKAAGVRAFREWLPMGDADYASYQIGDLATLFRLETRLIARTKQLELSDILRAGGDPRVAAEAFRKGPLADPARTMMGAKQEKWLTDAIARSTRDGTRWQILAQQTVMAPILLPKVTSSWYAPTVRPGPNAEAELRFAAMLTQMGIAEGMDRWDGYPAARDRLLGAAAHARANLVVLSGDSHNAWASDLIHDGAPVGVEFAGHSVSSLGIDKRFGGDPQTIAADFIATNPKLKWCDTSRRGYMVTNLTRNAASNEWLFLPSLTTRSTEILDRVAFSTERSSRQLSSQ
ncbi:alkaline phosphatase D family protein [Sphingomonas crocodyli]|uniref:Alkaline phosphatase n=1 Tax=Sphingomonas crocodyli TaxID=1979270 RepID=A0A437LZN8_9SPHN|nr:alkaline phosphatase D family protein [Sphingomonas crocodyli]RVT90898.1 alkaline phosphatase [Sphingomonas crocodyli]